MAMKESLPAPSSKTPAEKILFPTHQTTGSHSPPSPLSSVAHILAEVEEEMAKVSLSGLSDMDYHRLLPHGYTGQIITADKFGIVPSELFDLSFDRAITSIIANNPSGSLCIISQWIMEALSIARRRFSKLNLAIATDFRLPPVDIGIQGFNDLGGLCDFAVVELDIAMTASSYLRAGFEPPVPRLPTVTIVNEAKTGKSGVALASQAEAVGCLMVLSALDGSKGHNCVLTNGKSFTFLHLKDKHVWSTGELVSNSRRAKEIILGLLVYWVGGHDPTSIPGVEMHGSPTTVQ